MVTTIAAIIMILGILAIAAVLAACGYFGLRGGKKVVRKYVCPLRPRREKEQITFIVPFRTDHAERARNWEWLSRYYKHYFSDAQFIITSDDSVPFCKTAAINRGFRKATGDIIVMMDADCFIEPYVIRDAARKIREARKRGEKVWYLPYRRFYRLTDRFTKILLDTPPTNPPVIGDPPSAWQYTPLTKNSVSAGHWWGALIQVYPREAFELVGGMDERFKGWGGEDVSFMHAMDTLYAKHKTQGWPVYHLHHPSIPGTWKGTRQWAGQDKPEINDWLSTQYEEALGDPAAMRHLVRIPQDRNRLGDTSQSQR